MGFFLTALLWVGSLVLGRILNPKLPRIPGVDAVPEKFQGITAEEGRPIPVLWGTRQFKGANIGWFGDLSNTAIVQGGVTTGYKYYMGAQYLICHGPIDEVAAIHFNEKPVGAGIASGSNGIVFDVGGSPATALIAPGNYPGGREIAAAIEAAMKAALPGDWRVTFGFAIVAGMNDEIKFQIDSGTVYTVTIPAGSYTGVSLASTITSKLNSSPGKPAGDEFACLYFLGTGFEIALNTIQPPGGAWTSWTLKSSNGKSTIGFRHDVDHTATKPTVSLTSGFDVKVSRFIFSYGGTTATLRTTDAAFTAAATLGISTAADKTGLGIAISDSDFIVIAATYTDTTDYLQAEIDDSGFFGTEGGVQGRLHIYKGLLTQAASSYLTTQFGSTAPGYRGLAYAIQYRTGSPTGMYVGNTNYPKPISFTLRRCPNQLGLAGEQHNIAGDANPACMLWELLTDPIWGLGMAEAQFEKDTFLAAGATLYGEALGLSMILDATTPAADVVQEILRHIDGVLYVDHLSGLIAMRLARADYTVSELPLVSPANALACEIKQRSWDETRNVVRIRYVDRASNYVERVLQLQNQANIEARGGDMAVEDIPMPGLSNEAAAALVAGRSLKVLSALPRQVTIRANRESWALRPGAPFRLTWPWWGIADMPCRVSTIGLGGLTEGEIRIQAVQDVIGPAWIGFETPTEPPEDPPELPDLPEFTTPLGDQALLGNVPMPTG